MPGTKASYLLLSYILTGHLTTYISPSLNTKWLCTFLWLRLLPASYLSTLASHPSPLTPHLSPLTSHPSPLTPRLSPLASHPSPLTPRLLYLSGSALSFGPVCPRHRRQRRGAARAAHPPRLAHRRGLRSRLGLLPGLLTHLDWHTDVCCVAARMKDSSSSRVLAGA